MTNHVHLLLTPDEAGGVSRLMHTFARNYAGLFNRRHGRSGTLWEGRYKASLVDDGDYLMQCHRYIELNPLRAAMVVDPRDYRWSSHRVLAFGEADPLVQPHPAYLALGEDAPTRQRRYRDFVMATVAPTDIDALRRHLQRQHAYGSDRFRQAIEAQLGRSVGSQKIGQPRKPKPDPRQTPTQPSLVENSESRL
jgi:putative transposase